MEGISKKKEIDFLNGNLWKNIMVFSLPLIATNLLQLLFNVADLAVAGQFDGKEALGSIGSTTLLVTLFTTFIIGNANGVNSLTARFLGAKETSSVRKTITAGFFYMLVLGIILLILGVFLSRPVLSLLNTKSSFIEDSSSYLYIYMMGCPAVCIYNFGNAVLSAKGDTRKPLIILSLSGLLNVGLNFLFVLPLDMGVRGVAYASIISQHASAIAILLFIRLSKDETKLHFDIKNTDKEIIKELSSLSIISGIQNAIFALANLVVQYGVNSFDDTMVAGNSASLNADNLVYDVMAAFYTAGCSFVSQNYGAENKKRIKESYLISMLYAFAFALAMGIILYAFGTQFLSIFNTDKDVIRCGMYRLEIMSLSYCVSAFMDASIAASRGLGKTTMPTVFVVIGSCIFRIIWIFTVFRCFDTIQSLYTLYVFSFTFTGIMEVSYFIHLYKKLQF